jgi:hypothetical protein
MIERIIIFVVVAVAAALLVRTVWRSWTRRDRCACGTDPAQCPLSGTAECKPDTGAGCPAVDRLRDRVRAGVSLEEKPGRR